MKKLRRFVGILLSALMLTAVLSPISGAGPTVYFTSVNDTILNLNDETMPFWQGSMLYIPHTALDDGRVPKELGIYCSYNHEKQLVTLIQSRKVLIADIAAGTIYDRDENYYAGKAIVRGDIAFLPVETVVRYFDLQYSYTKVTNGYLVRIRDSNAVLSDSRFIDAATAPMAQRYSQYEKAHTTDTRTEDAAVPGSESTTARTAYPVFLVSDASASEAILSAIGGGTATFLLDASALAGTDDLLRRVVASGSALALRIDASADAEKTIDAIVRANDALWAACNQKTRLVFLSGAAETVTKAVEAAGYCPVSFALDYSEDLPSAARTANGILSCAEEKDVCTVLLGRDTDVKKTITTVVSALRTGNCALSRLNEVTARS